MYIVKEGIKYLTFRLTFRLTLSPKELKNELYESMNSINYKLNVKMDSNHIHDCLYMSIYIVNKVCH